MSCNSVKNVSDGAYLLTNNEIYIDSVKTSKSLLKEQLYQKPNVKVAGIPLRLHTYNLARKNRDSIFDHWLYKKPNREKHLISLLSKKQLDRLRESVLNFNTWLKTAGEAPVIIDSVKTERSIKRLESYYWNNGWFNVSADFKTTLSGNKKADQQYYVNLRQPYNLGNINTSIASKVADSIYQLHTKESLLTPGERYKTLDMEGERNRITKIFRNSGLYHFDQDFIKFEADTVNTDHKVNIDFQIVNRPITEGDSVARIPYRIHKISGVNIITDGNFKNSQKSFSDSASYDGYKLYSYERLRFRPKALTNAIFIHPNTIYRDQDRSLTYNQVNNLRMFKYPSISYQADPKDPNGSDLIANIVLTPLKKYAVSFDFDVSTSTIQKFGIGFGGSLLARNVFKGAEILELSGRGSIGSSRDPIQEDTRFFNITEIGADLKLTIPRILFPINTDWVVPKSMSPRTAMSIGLNTQQNIGLDKQNVTGVFNYNWKSSIRSTNQMDLLNVQYVRNLNTSNYFNVYGTSLTGLEEVANTLPDGVLDAPLDAQNADRFIDDVQSGLYNSFLNSNQRQQVANINERKDRLTEDNLIFTTNFTYLRNSKQNLYDEDYSRLRIKLELAGNFLASIAKASGLERNSNERFDIFGVEFSQYIKTEIGYIKHFDLGHRNVFAIRTFGGIAIPYGNANSIPFARSFFGGGANDNRGWQAYDLGPGSSGGLNEFNEANLKLAFNLEHRFNIAGSLYGALFADIGNIWNISDNEEEETATFDGIEDLKELAVGSGFGLRYDFSFFVFRLDLGFKTYNPAFDGDNRWFKGYNFSEVVYNIGINYPF